MSVYLFYLNHFLRLNTSQRFCLSPVGGATVMPKAHSFTWPFSPKQYKVSQAPVLAPSWAVQGLKVFLTGSGLSPSLKLNLISFTAEWKASMPWSYTQTHTAGSATDQRCYTPEGPQWISTDVFFFLLFSHTLVISFSWRVKCGV